MIGNDIVDLQLAAIESNWGRSGYLNKIFTLFEQQLITQAQNPTQMVWLLWSMKEAAYKIHATAYNLRNFAPTKLSCSSLSFNTTNATGIITIANNSYFTQSEINSTFVHSLAATQKGQLAKIESTIYTQPHWLPNYKSTQPKCVSHHGKFLALIY